MTLATVDEQGRPHCRVLLLKGLDERGFTFFSNYDSAKGRQMAARPFAAMTFFWPSLERQVRIEGRIERVTAGESDGYYQVRPLGSRIGAWASPQSKVISRSRRARGPAGPRPRNAFSIRRRTARHTGAVIACCRIASSSGKGARVVCMTASTIACRARPGFASASRPEQVLRRGIVKRR
jgi:hypothetical protein